MQIWRDGDVEVAIFDTEGNALEEGRRAVGRREGLGGTHVRSSAGMAHRGLTVGDVIEYTKAHVSPHYKMYGNGRHNCQDVSRQVFNWAK
jgi:hypothetical protein